MPFAEEALQEVREITAGALGMSREDMKAAEGQTFYLRIFSRFLQQMGDPDWAGQSRFADAYRRWSNRKELDRLIGEWTGTREVDEVMAALQAEGVAATPCADTEARYFNPHLQDRENIVNVEHPVTGVDFVPNVVCNLSETPGEIRRPAPLLGEHNDYVFGELLGLPREEIDRMIDRKIIY